MPFTVPKSWFANCDFTTDWSSRAFEDWVEHLGRLREKPLEILEIGAWEGRGSLFFLNFFPNSKLTALDIFTLGNEGRFDANVLNRFPTRTTKVKGSSTTELDRFAVEGSKFDLIYLDGSHLRDDVLLDSILAWRLLKVGGYLIWDDYELVKAMPEQFTKSDQDPKPAIDVFIAWHGKEMEILHREYQVIARKKAAHYHEDIPIELSRASDTNLREARRKADEFEQRVAEVERMLLAEQEKLAKSESRVAEAEATLASKRATFQRIEHELREETKRTFLRLGQAQAEAAALQERLAAEIAERAKLDERLARQIADKVKVDERLRSSQASARRQIEDLRAELHSAREEQSAAEAAVSKAEAALTQRYHELAMLADLLRDQEGINENLTEQVNWLRDLHEAVLNQPAWWGLLPGGIRRRRQRDWLKRSGAFDCAAYLERYPDVAAAGFEPLTHYVRHGLGEGRLR